ncbi:MAG: peptide chain release factor 2 [Dehalococcoidia bacterium]|nr:peptide chain release factor 2 [Dehalococcoidia bacterium]
MDELRQRVTELLERVGTCRCVFDLPAQQRALAEAQQQAARPGLWDNSQAAQQLMRRVARLESLITTWTELERRSADLEALVALAADTAGAERAALTADLDAELGGLERQFAELELTLTLGGEYDARNAVLSVHAGAGGTEAQDWAEMLLRMYLRWADSRGYPNEIISISPGDEAGIKSADIRIEGEYAYGLLRSERGVHRLVRISPFDGSHSRHTSFALVEVMPETETGDVRIEIRPDDLRIDTYRASGHGGQNVQKNDTAVRITHLPSGIVVTCQNERSQGRNRETAMAVLKSRLLERELERLEAERAEIRGVHVEAGWGNQIRSYVLHPYKMVKDLRTNVETSNTAAVLDGGIDEFIRAYLRSHVGSAAGEEIAS